MMFVALALLSLSAWDPDAVVTTARGQQGAVPLVETLPEVPSPSSTVSSAASTLSTQEQIDRWIGTRPDEAPQPQWREPEPRRVTGEVSLGIGTGDYSHGSAYVTLPLGETGQLTLGYSQTKNGWLERPYGREGLFWDPRDEFLGPQWVTPSGRSYTPFGDGRRLIPEPRDTTQ